MVSSVNQDQNKDPLPGLEVKPQGDTWKPGGRNPVKSQPIQQSVCGFESLTRLKVEWATDRTGSGTCELDRLDPVDSQTIQ